MKNKLFVALSFLTFFCCLVGCSNLSDSSQGVSFDNGCYECKNCLYHSGLLSSGEGVDFGDGPFECPNCHENDMYVVQSASIKDFSAGIKLLDDGQTKMCPYMNKAYLVTTTKDFVLTVYSNKGKSFTDDVVTFPAATGVVDGDVHYTSFGSYKYDASYDKSSYVLNFTQKGKLK